MHLPLGESQDVCRLAIIALMGGGERRSLQGQFLLP